ncbi:MAG TPA: hypothetical protein VD907_00565 [Verrucomicrobiae bacterium]|nr:hypothetical protein [Verrucomicrobiae bacterium]
MKNGRLVASDLAIFGVLCGSTGLTYEQIAVKSKQRETAVRQFRTEMNEIFGKNANASIYGLQRHCRQLSICENCQKAVPKPRFRLKQDHELVRRLNDIEILFIERYVNDQADNLPEELATRLARRIADAWITVAHNIDELESFCHQNNLFNLFVR